MSSSRAKRLGAIPSASGTLTRLAYAHAKKNNIDLRTLLNDSNLTHHQIKDANARLRAADQIAFLNLAAAALNDDLLGFHLAQAPDLRELGFLYYIAASSDSLADALKRMARYGSMANECVSPRYLSGAVLGISISYVGVSRHQDRHQIEFFVAILVRLCQHLTGVRLVPTKVKFIHRRDRHRSALAALLGNNVEFGATADEVSFAAASANMPVIGADTHLNKLLVAYCEDALRRRIALRSSFQSSVENAIVPLLPHGGATLDGAARRLGVSQRTLARRLADEGLTFSAVLEKLRTDLAARYLAEEHLSISQIAWLLGYREVSSFTHAFKRWTGTTPGQARARRAD